MNPTDRPSSSAAGSPAGRGETLRGLRVFVAEDEFLVATVLEDDLSLAGCFIVGPFTSLAKATEGSRRETFDLAILDINMNGEMIFPLADELIARGVPFLFLSGYSAANLPERFRTAPRLAKPYDPAALLRELDRLAEAARRRA